MTYLQMNNITDSNTRIIIGNPGCGKTSTLINELKQVAESGIPLTQLMYSSFSRAAIEEAVTRALAALHLTSDKNAWNKELKYFKTMHALAYHFLGLSADSLLSGYNLQNFGKLVGLVFSADITEDIMRRKNFQTRGDKAMAIIQTARLLNRSIRDYMIGEKIEEFTIHDIEDLAKRYQDFKILNSLYDYTDMLIMAQHTDFEVPHLHTLFVDEAQDLSTMHWILVNKFAANAEHIIIAGDDKQAINTFAGADIDTFLSLKGKVETLEQSYRIPKKIYTLANTVMSKMRKYRKEGSSWKPRREEGSWEYCNTIPWRKIITGDWLLLARTESQLRDLRDRMLTLEIGAIPFTIKGQPPIDTDIFVVLNLLEMQKEGKINLLSDYLLLTDEDTEERRKAKLDYIRMFKKFFDCSTPPGRPWEIDESFINAISAGTFSCGKKLSRNEIRYAKKLYPLYKTKKNNLFTDSKVRLMTIHTAKGREADNVLVCLAIPQQVRNVIMENVSDVEAKVLYVAITRARKHLYLMRPRKAGVSFEKYLH